MHLHVILALAACLAASGVAAQDIVRCKDVLGAVTYQPAPCPDRTEESRPQIPASYPEPNKAESQRIFEREAERRHQELLAAQAQPQYVVAYPLWRGYRPARPAHHLPRHSGPAIR